MTVKELRNKLDWYIENTYNNENNRVVIVTKNPSLGGLSCVDIKSISPGFDWNKGKMLIFTSEDVMKVHE